MLAALPPTSPLLADDAHRPYFLWWTTATVGELRARIDDPDPEVRAYWIGAVLREANTRDVWLFVTPDVIRASWDRLQRHLGRSRAMWAYLLGLPDEALDVQQLRAFRDELQERFRRLALPPDTR